MASNKSRHDTLLDINLMGPKYRLAEKIVRSNNRQREKIPGLLRNYRQNPDANNSKALAENIADACTQPGQQDFIIDILKQVSGLNLKNYIDDTQLKTLTNYPEILSLLVKNNNVDINKKDKEGSTVLFYASFGSPLSLKSLLLLGADPTIKNNMGISPLDRWINAYDIEKLKLCNQTKPDILFKKDENDIRPIDKILRSRNPKNNPHINNEIFKELGLTPEQIKREDSKDGQYEKTKMKEIIGGISHRSIEKRLASSRLIDALKEDNFERAAAVIKNSDNFSTTEQIFKNDQSKIIQKLLKSENKGAIKVLEALIEKGFALDVTRFKGKRNFLHIAAEKSPKGTFILLLDMQPKLRTIRDSEGNTPLHLFAKRKDETLESIKEINKKFPDLQTKENKEKQTPLTIFFNTHNSKNDPKQNHELVKSLGLDPIETLNETGTLKTNLSTFDKIRTEFNLKSEIIAKTKQDKTDNLSDRNKRYINSKDRTGQRAIHYAAKLGYEQSARNLIANGADIDLKDYSGKTALHHAIENNRSAVAKILIEKGANINLADNNGETALTLAAKEKENDQELTTAILSKMAPDYSENSLVIDKAIYSCNLKTFEKILEHIEFSYNHNPLDILVYKCKLKEDTYNDDYAEKIKLLVKKGIEPNIEGKEKTYPLDIIARAFGVSPKGTWNEIKAQLPKETQEALKEAEKARQKAEEEAKAKQEAPLKTTDPSSQTFLSSVLSKRSNTGSSRQLGG